MFIFDIKNYLKFNDFEKLVLLHIFRYNKTYKINGLRKN